MTGGKSTNGGCKFRKDQPQKTLSVEIRLHRDCDSRWVTDSVPEVIMDPQRMGQVVYMAHNFGN